MKFQEVLNEAARLDTLNKISDILGTSKSKVDLNKSVEDILGKSKVKRDTSKSTKAQVEEILGKTEVKKAKQKEKQISKELQKVIAKSKDDTTVKFSSDLKDELAEERRLKKILGKEGLEAAMALLGKNPTNRELKAYIDVYKYPKPPIQTTMDKIMSFLDDLID
jgi:hypothetical protein